MGAEIRLMHIQTFPQWQRRKKSTMPRHKDDEMKVYTHSAFVHGHNFLVGDVGKKYSDKSQNKLVRVKITGVSKRDDFEQNEM